jgi:hypothetical protein
MQFECEIKIEKSKCWVNSQDVEDNPFDQPRSADLGNRKISVASSVMPLDGQLH